MPCCNRSRARGGGLALVPTAPEVARNRDSLFAYRHDSYFYYLSGFAEPEAVIALVAGPEGDKHVLFCRERNEEREIWDGFRYGPDAAREIFGFDEAHPIAALRDGCRTSRPTGPRCTRRSACSAWDQEITDLLNAVRNRARTGVAAPEEVVDVRASLDTMRLVKDAHEVALMRAPAPFRAARTGARWRSRAPGCHEYQVEAELMHAFLQRRRAGGRLQRRSSRRGPMLACFITATTTGR